jgi:hypothetical protein
VDGDGFFLKAPQKAGFIVGLAFLPEAPEDASRFEGDIDWNLTNDTCGIDSTLAGLMMQLG